MLTLRWRMARSSLVETLLRSAPPIWTLPEVGFHSPLSMRMSVDFPDPDRPMMTKISPRPTAKLASMTAAVPRCLTASRPAPCLSWRTASFGRRPKTL